MNKFENKYLNDIVLKSGIIEHESFEIDPKKGFEKQEFSYTLDMILISFPANDSLLVDVGWIPEFDPNGQFRIQIISNEEWDKPIYIKFSKTIQDMKNFLQEAIDIADSLSHTNEKI